MCYYCHILGFNSYAPQHRSKNCYDIGNTHSLIAIERRNVDTRDAPKCLTCNFALGAHNACRKMDYCPQHFTHCFQHCKDNITEDKID